MMTLSSGRARFQSQAMGQSNGFESRTTFPVGRELERDRGGGMRPARLGLSAEENDLVAHALQGFADGERVGLDAADLARAGLVERGVG
jgi:hypothetical protein